jgi:chromosomal replication initiator protein
VSEVLSLWHGRVTVKPTMAQIASEVAERHGLTVDDLKGHSRVRCYAWPRQEAMWRIRNATNKSLPAIARFFGGRDHTTVLYACRTYERRCASRIAAE